MSVFKRITLAAGLLCAGIAVSLFSCGYAVAQVGADDGLFASTPIVTVTNCNDAGTGSFRQAVEFTSGKRNVEFAVACDLTLLSAVTVNSGELWIRGETAPAPGWTIRGQRLEIKRGVVKVTHMRFRTGPGAFPTVQDALAITGAAYGTPTNCAGQRDMGNIILEHVSVAWGQDENVQIWGCNLHNITVRDSIIAEGLKTSGHPSGDHSMGLLVGGGAQNILILRNLFISNQYRSPVLTDGVTAAVVNNWVHNPMHYAIHIYAGTSYTEGTKAAIIGNLISQGPNTQNDLQIGSGTTNAVNAGTQIYLSGNLQEGNITALNVTEVPNASLVGTNPVTLPAWLTPVPVYALEATLVNCANPSASDVGPMRKDATDIRLITEACARGGSMKNAPVTE